MKRDIDPNTTILLLVMFFGLIIGAYIHGAKEQEIYNLKMALKIGGCK